MHGDDLPMDVPTLAGLPRAQVMAFLRQARTYDRFGVPAVAVLLRLDAAAAEALVQTLAGAGLLEPRPHQGLEAQYALSRAGRRLVADRHGRGMARVAAERRVEAFLRRVERVNADPRVLYRVERALLFGDILGGGPRVARLEVAVHLVPKAATEEGHWAALETRWRELAARGRRFRGIAEMVGFPRREALRLLAGRARGLALHDGLHRVPGHPEPKVIHPGAAVVRRRVEGRTMARSPRPSIRERPCISPPPPSSSSSRR